jgi:hypothetical protein
LRFRKRPRKISRFFSYVGRAASRYAANKTPTIAYERYTELISKHIHRTVSAQEKADDEKYETAQPKTCPLCGAAVWIFLEPFRVAHDVEKCEGKAGGEN